MKEWYQLQLLEVDRLKHLWPKRGHAASDLCAVVGVFWLWRHGARRHFRVYPWSARKEWYVIDVTLPHMYRGVEMEHTSRHERDVLRDHRLTEIGWTVLRVKPQEISDDPRAVRMRVRRFLSA